MTKEERLNAEPSVLTEYEMIQRAEMDKRSMLKYEKIQIALNFIEMGLDDETISKGLGLSMEEIKKLRK